jgi:hypothetical protein
MKPSRIAVLVLGGWLFAAVAAAADPTVELAGSREFPGVLAEGGPPIGGLSGLAWLADDEWVAVMDNSARLVRFRLAVSADGVPESVHDLRLVTLAARHDYEDVAGCPPALAGAFLGAAAAAARPAAGSQVLVCEEDTPAIHVVATESGAMLGRVPLPDVLAGRRRNRGLEVLAIDSDRSRVWTATEEALTPDGPAAATGTGTVVRFVRVMPARGAGGVETCQFAYRVDPPHRVLTVREGAPFSGVVAFAPLSDGRLLVLERSAAVGLPPFENRIYLADPAAADDVTGVARDLSAWQGRWVAKRLLWRGSLGCNLEGLAIGPDLPNGGRVLVAIADGGDLGAPGRIVGFRLTSP